MEEEIKPKWNLKKAIVNSFKWDKNDWEYIKSHIVWLLIILALAGLYYSEVSKAREFIGSDCVHRCQVERYIIDFKSKNPDIQINCDSDTGVCRYSGVLDSGMKKSFENYGINLTS